MEGLSAADRDEMLQLFHGAHAAPGVAPPAAASDDTAGDTQPDGMQTHPDVAGHADATCAPEPPAPGVAEAAGEEFEDCQERPPDQPGVAWDFAGAFAAARRAQETRLGLGPASPGDCAICHETLADGAIA